jgi:hypothetical protein
MNYTLTESEQFPCERCSFAEEFLACSLLSFRPSLRLGVRKKGGCLWMPSRY